MGADLDRRETQRLKPYLSPRPIDAMLKRRDKLVEILQARIDERGEGGVIYDESQLTFDADVAAEDATFDEDRPAESVSPEPP